MFHAVSSLKARPRQVHPDNIEMGQKPSEMVVNPVSFKEWCKSLMLFFIVVIYVCLSFVLAVVLSHYAVISIQYLFAVSYEIAFFKIQGGCFILSKIVLFLNCC